MSTTFYFTSGASSGVVLSGKQASFGVDVTWSGAANYATSGLAMVTSNTAGNSGVGISGASLAGKSGIAQTHHMHTFVSPPLAAQGISSGNTYTFSFTVGESGTTGNFLVSGLAAYVYLFRSGSISVLASGFISGIAVSSGTLVSGTLVSGTIVGTSGSANSGDVIVAELYWLSGIQNISGSTNLTIGFGSGAYT